MDERDWVIGILAALVLIILLGGFGFGGYGMGPWMMGYGYGFGQLFFWLVILVVIGGLVYLLLGRENDVSKLFGEKDDPIELLRSRYAKGEIKRGEYLKAKKILEGIDEGQSKAERGA